MNNASLIIASNIQKELKKENKKQTDLARSLNVSEQTVSKMLNGSRMISAIELQEISNFLHVSMEKLLEIPVKPIDNDIIHVFMGRVKTKEGKEGLKFIDELSKEILFNNRVYENGLRGMEPINNNE